MGSEGPKSTTMATLAATLIILQLAGGVQALAFMHYPGVPSPVCIGIGPGAPPDVVVDPDCAPPGARDALGGEQGSTDPSGVRANATLVSSEVQVTWQVNETWRSVAAFHVLRGATPDDLHRIAVVGAGESVYRDTGAVLSGESLWYAVAVEFTEDRPDVTSRPVLVEA